MASLCIPILNLHKIVVNFPRPNHPMPTVRNGEAQVLDDFDGLVKIVPHLVIISSFTVESYIRSAFYSDSLHSMECGAMGLPPSSGGPNFHLSWLLSVAFVVQI